MLRNDVRILSWNVGGIIFLLVLVILPHDLVLLYLCSLNFVFSFVGDILCLKVFNIIDLMSSYKQNQPLSRHQLHQYIIYFMLLERDGSLKLVWKHHMQCKQIHVCRDQRKFRYFSFCVDCIIQFEFVVWWFIRITVARNIKWGNVNTILSWSCSLNL